MFRRLRVVALLLVVLGVAALTGEWAIRRTPLPEGLTTPPSATPALADRHGRVFSVLPTPEARHSEPRPLREMGPWLPLATVGIEDHRFLRHRGIDFHALLGAAWRNLREGRILSGASTISQQLIKNASGRSRRTFSAKVYEAFAAARLERTWSKKQILEAYLNRLDYGNRRLGPGAAAWAYFGKTPADLSLAEAIYLAGLPQSPSRLNPWKNPAGALARYRRNVLRLAALGLLPPGTDAGFLQAHPPSVIRNTMPNQAPHFAQALWHRHPADAKSAVTTTLTTLNLPLQQTAEHLLQEHLTALSSRGVGEVAIVIVENATGQIRALACAGSARHAAINSALEPRSSGSTLKPFLYLAAIDQRLMTAATLLPDTPDAITEEYRDYDPQNYSDRYYGPVRLRTALGNSLNVPAVAALSRLGARTTFEHLRGWGLDFPQSFDECGAGFILGNARVRLLDLAGAYAALARGGEAWSPKFTPRDPVESRTMASPAACAIITDILCDPAARSLSFGTASPLNLPQRTAVKTGTSSGFRDGWCVGFNGRHTVAVWAGNLDGQLMEELLAVRSAAPLWAQMMNHLYAAGDPPVAAPTETVLLQNVPVAAETGLLPRPDEPRIEEWFLSGTAPTEPAASWYVRGVLQLPMTYAAWCASPHNHLGAVTRDGPLKILFPRDGTVFAWNPHLAPGKQVLHASASENHCEWQINNGPRLRAENGPRLVLQKGDWTVRAFRGEEMAETHFRVE